MKSSLSLPEKYEYIQQFGNHALAYSTLQDGLDSFSVNGKGYIAYRNFGTFGKQAFVLADPICASTDKEYLLDAFLAEFPKSVFVQIGTDTARILSGKGFYVNEFGTESSIDIPSFKISGNKMEFVRRQYKAAQAAGVAVHEISPPKTDQALLEEISKEWISTKTSKKKELAFLARPAVYAEESGVRKFYEFQNDQLIGFAFFSPKYSEGKIEGYYLDIHRHIKEVDDQTNKGTNIEILLSAGINGAPKGMSYFTTIEAMKKFREEGVKTLALGLSPFHGVEDTDLSHSRITKSMFRYLYDCNLDEPGNIAEIAAQAAGQATGTKGLFLRGLGLAHREKVQKILLSVHKIAFAKYNNKGNYFFKSRWRGNENNVYLASKNAVPIMTIIDLYRICNVL